MVFIIETENPSESFFRSLYMLTDFLDVKANGLYLLAHLKMKYKSIINDNI